MLAPKPSAVVPRVRREPPMSPPPPGPIDPAALDRIPESRFVMTASFENRRAGMAVRWVQRAALAPHSISLALPKGHVISPIVRDARAFGLCQIASDDRMLDRRFDNAEPDEVDPFDALEVFRLETGAPMLRRAVMCLDCRVSMHIDFDADHELFVAEVVAAVIGAGHDAPIVRCAGSVWNRDETRS
jgi:flavin reductase (DIM6/NTAB) family NADH-FMN oxidoreductase RutF